MTKKTRLKDQIESEVTPSNAEQEKRKTRTRRKSYVMDLRIYSPASLGSISIEGIDTAPALVRLAKVKGLDVIAVTDLYSGEFIDEIAEAAVESPLTVIPGVDIRCSVGVCDNVLVSCLFPETHTSESIEELLSALDIPDHAKRNENYVVEKDFGEIIEIVESHEGKCLPSRIDKTPQRLRTVPILVEEYGFRAFDITYPSTKAYFKEKWPKVKFELFSFSNATALAQVGSRIAKVKMHNPGFLGIQEVIARDGVEEAAS